MPMHQNDLDDSIPEESIRIIIIQLQRIVEQNDQLIALIKSIGE